MTLVCERTMKRLGLMPLPLALCKMDYLRDDSTFWLTRRILQPGLASTNSILHWKGDDDHHPAAFDRAVSGTPLSRQTLACRQI